MLIKMSEGIFKNFYNSRRWRRCAKAYAQSKLYICERCGGYKTGTKDDGTRQRWVVHHKKPMDAVTIQDDNLAYGWDNLMFLCIECHNAIHHEMETYSKHQALTSGAKLLRGRGRRREVSFDENGDVIVVQDIDNTDENTPP